MPHFIQKIRIRKFTTEFYFWIIILSLGILYLVFDTSLATVYTIVFVADFVLYYFNYRSDKVIQFPLEKRTDNRFKSIMTAIVAYGIFLIISTGLLMLTSPQSIAGIGDFQAVWGIMASSVPIFAGSVLLSIYAYAILVPALESSLFFGRLFEKIKSVAGGNITWGNKFSKKTIFTIIACMSAFVLYHMGAKGLSNIPLMITGIFAIISCLLVLKDGELKSAIMLHIINNLLIVLSQFRII